MPSSNKSKSPESSPESSPEISKVEMEGGRRYEASKAYRDPVTDPQLDRRTKRFHEKATAMHSTEYPSPRQAKFAPSASAGQVHQVHEAYFSTTERVDKSKGLGSNKDNQAYNKAVGDRGHRSDNKCAEGGTTGMIQLKYGAEVSMQGDRIATYGSIQSAPGQKPKLGYHPACADGTPPDPMGCEGVLQTMGIVDIHARPKKN